MMLFTPEQTVPYFRKHPNARKRFVGLVGCGKRKQRSGVWPAKELYTGGFTQACIEWIARNCRDWYILSAMHGLLLPDEGLTPYQLKLTELAPEAQKEWGRRVEDKLRRLEPPRRRYLVLAGLPYLDALPDRLRAKCLPVFPGGLAMGLRMSWLKKNPVLDDDVIQHIQAAKFAQEQK